jgi:hypothetical protein
MYSAMVVFSRGANQPLRGTKERLVLPGVFLGGLGVFRGEAMVYSFVLSRILA